MILEGKALDIAAPENPIDPPPPGASVWFDGNSEDNQVSQLLCLGLYLNGRYDDDEQPLIDEARRLGVPFVRVAGETARHESMAYLTALSLKLDEYFRPSYLMGNPGDEERQRIPSLNREHVLRLWNNMETWRSARSAIALLYLNLNNASELVRATAAAVLAAVRDPENAVVTDVLATSRDISGYAGEFARIASAYTFEPPSLDPESSNSETTDSDALAESPDDGANDWGKDPLSVIVHGTFSGGGNLQKKWYFPRADLPVRIRSNCTPSLYAESADFFKWTGSYRPSKRDEAARKLSQWCSSRSPSGIDTVIAHSHGGTVAIKAIIEQGLRVRLLVLLHTPVIKRQDWNVLLARVGRIADFRAPFDWVVSLDRIFTGSANALPKELLSISKDLSMQLSGKTRFSHVYYRTDSTWDNEAIPPKIAGQRARA